MTPGRFSPGKLFVIAARALMVVAALATMAMMFHVTADIIWKYLFIAPIRGTLEIVAGWYMVAVVFCSIAYVEVKQGHIVVDLFTRGLRPGRLNALRTFNYALSAVYVAVLAWLALEEALRRTAQNEVWETVNGYLSIWPSRWLVVAGFAVLLCLFAVRSVQALRAARDPERVAFVGPEDAH
ncbi:TRAP transporter small permease [Marinibaculum pumilum]|uniref:TRAP transporter small permease protein n=1 Tax=Marinibaculum pumilum TaxID=1766165 RepID=A0ABV7L4M4_9PROT